MDYSTFCAIVADIFSLVISIYGAYKIMKSLCLYPRGACASKHVLHMKQGIILI